MLPIDDEFEAREQLILRDHLALVRTRLANERTLLSYLRSGLYLLLGGIALVQVEGFSRIHWMGFLAMGLSMVFTAFGIYRFISLRRQLRKYYPLPDKTLREPR